MARELMEVEGLPLREAARRLRVSKSVLHRARLTADERPMTEQAISFERDRLLLTNPLFAHWLWGNSPGAPCNHTSANRGNAASLEEAEPIDSSRVK